MDLTIQLREEKGAAGPCTVLDLTGELDTYSSPTVKNQIVGLVDQGTKRLLVNLAGVRYIDSAGLGTLVGGLKRSAENGGELKVVNASDQIQRIFDITGLVRVFDSYLDEHEALGSFRRGEGDR